MRKLKFPSYEYIKSLPTYDKESDIPIDYKWILFNTPVNVWGRLSYYKEGENYIRFDIIEGGYIDRNGLNWSGEFNQENYKKLCEHAQKVFESIYEALDEDCSKYWDEDAKNSIDKT